MAAQSVTFTGDNADDIRALDVHVVEHPTQQAVIVYADEDALDPVGLASAGQTVISDGDGVRIAGVPDSATPPPVEVAAETADVPDAFDPSKHSVEEVQAYLASLGDDDNTEAQRVIDAEKNGKDRVSLVG